MNSSEPTTSSWKPQVSSDAVQKIRRRYEIVIAMKKKTKKNNTTGEEYVDNEEHDHDEIVDLENTDAHYQSSNNRRRRFVKHVNDRTAFGRVADVYKPPRKC